LKWLADENIPVASIRFLREAGENISSVVECDPGANDEAILRLARDEDRGLLTFDRDFGELVFRRQLLAPPAIVYMRFLPRDPEETASVVLNLFGTDEAIAGHFIVLDRDGFRRRRLPDLTA